MAEKETVFSSKIKYKGVFSFKDFYKFGYDWLKDEMGMDISEKKYEEKIKGDSKDIEVRWSGEKAVTDYFKFEVEVTLVVDGLTAVEITEDGVKVSTNKGGIGVDVKGTLVRDYDGKFEMSAFKKFMRGMYEKWVIPSRVEEYKGKLGSQCDEFLSQAKAYLDLEGKR